MRRMIKHILAAAIFLILPISSTSKELPKMAVWDLTARSIPPDLALQLTDILASEFNKLGQYEIFSQENVRTLAGWESQKLMLGCTDVKCLTALGQMDVSKLVSGSVGKVGDRYAVSLNMFDTMNVKSENWISEFCNSENELIELVQSSARKLLGVKEVASVPPSIAKPEAALTPPPYPAPSVKVTKEIKQERGKRGGIGVYAQKITPDIAQALGLKDNKGALVADLIAGGPAESGGIKRGDVIVTFDGKNIDEMNELPRVVAATPPGKNVEVGILRDGKPRTIKLKVGELKEE